MVLIICIITSWSNNVRKKNRFKGIVEFYKRTILILILTELNDRAFWLSKPTQWCDGCIRYHHKSINIYLCCSTCFFLSLSFFFRSKSVMQSKPLLLSTMITTTSTKGRFPETNDGNRRYNWMTLRLYFVFLKRNIILFGVIIEEIFIQW